jgi:Tetratricopeptide repeat
MTAIDVFQRCLALAPNHAAVAYNLGNALRQAGKPVDAIHAFLRCLRLVPDFGPAYVNLADTLRHLGMLEQARVMAILVCSMCRICRRRRFTSRTCSMTTPSRKPQPRYTQVLARLPGHAGAVGNLGNTLRAMGRLPETLAAHDRAVTAAPMHFRFDIAMKRLAAGDFLRGWDEFEWRWQNPENRPRGFGEPWCGEAIAGRTILLHAEQGLGDTLQFVRYAPMVAARDCRVLLAVQPALMRLLQALPGVVEVIARGDTLPPFDVHCPPAKPATCVRHKAGDDPSRGSLSARRPGGGGRMADEIARQRQSPRRLVWSGSPHNDNAGAHKVDRRRSIPLAEFAPLGDLPGVNLVSL